MVDCGEQGLAAADAYLTWYNIAVCPASLSPLHAASIIVASSCANPCCAPAGDRSKIYPIRLSWYDAMTSYQQDSFLSFASFGSNIYIVVRGSNVMLAQVIVSEYKYGFIFTSMRGINQCPSFVTTSLIS